MKAGLERYAEGQVYLLNDGRFVLITSVDPRTNLNKNEDTRRCLCKIGKRHEKNDEFKQYAVVIENAPLNHSITFDMGKGAEYTITELRSREAKYIGILTPESAKMTGRASAEYVNSL